MKPVWKFYFKTEFYKHNEEWQKVDEDQNLAMLSGQQLYRLARFYSIMTNSDELANIRINTKCHYRCVHCFIDDRKKHHDFIDVDFDRIINKIDEKSSRQVVLLTGGEPLFHPRFKEILQHCKDKNLIVSLESNLPGFDNEEKAKEYADLIDMVILPMYSWDEETYENVSQIKGSYKRQMKTIENIEKYMPNTGINFVVIPIKPIMDKFYYTIESLYNKFPRSPIYIGASCFGGPSYSNEISPSFSEISEVYGKVIQDFGDQLITLYTPLCFMYPNQHKPHVGEIESMGHDGLDILNNEAADVFYDRLLGHRYKPIQCKLCHLNNKCDGFLELYKEVYDADVEIKPVLDEAYRKHENGNCDRCGKALVNNKIKLYTQIVQTKDDEVLYKQPGALVRDLCADCTNTIINKIGKV